MLGVWLGGSYKLAPAAARSTLTHVLIEVLILLGARARRRPPDARSARYALARGSRCRCSRGSLVTTPSRRGRQRQDADAHLAGRDAARVGGVAALRDDARPRAPPRSRRALAGSRSRPACSRPTRCSTTRPTSRRRRATGRWNRSTRASPAGGPRCSPTSTNTRMYVLRDLDIGGPDFVYPPPARRGRRRRLRRPGATRTACRRRRSLAYPLIVTRRDPAAPRPPAAYRARRGRAPTTRSGNAGPAPRPRWRTSR